ncbi:hypothetical protein, partial [Sinorhizobium medicae]|uniref:hypothetical protein n=1 Tax=Sinorhizobium medicae TaxID=110321 RepID=UPI002B1BDBCB
SAWNVFFDGIAGANAQSCAAAPVITSCQVTVAASSERTDIDSVNGLHKFPLKGCMRNETFRATRRPTGAQSGLRLRLGDAFRFARSAS